MTMLKYVVDVAVSDDADQKGIGQAIERIVAEQLKQVKAAEVRPVDGWGTVTPQPADAITATSPSKRVRSGKYTVVQRREGTLAGKAARDLEGL